MHYETADSFHPDDFPLTPTISATTPGGHIIGHNDMGGGGPGLGLGPGGCGPGGFFPGVAPPPHKGRPRKRKNQQSLQEADMFGGHGMGKSVCRRGNGQTLVGIVTESSSGGEPPYPLRLFADRGKSLFFQTFSI